MLRWVEIGIVIAAFLIGYSLAQYRDAAKANAELVQAQKAQMAAADLASTKEAQRLTAEAAQADLSRQLEDAANAQAPIATCLPVDRVLRLNKR